MTSLAQPSQANTTALALRAYYGVKDALVTDDAAKAKSRAGELVKALGSVPVDSLSTADKKALTLAKTRALSMSQPGNVETQREQFAALSTGMIAVTRANKPAKVYVQYCPMKNASWLSDKKQVKNPYYGSRMLGCGSVKEEI